MTEHVQRTPHQDNYNSHTHNMCFFILDRLLAYLPTTLNMRGHIYVHERNVTCEKRTRTWRFFLHFSLFPKAFYHLQLLWTYFTQTFIISLVYHKYFETRISYVAHETKLYISSTYVSSGLYVFYFRETVNRVLVLSI